MAFPELSLYVVANVLKSNLLCARKMHTICTKLQIIFTSTVLHVSAINDNPQGGINTNEYENNNYCIFFVVICDYI